MHVRRSTSFEIPRILAFTNLKENFNYIDAHSEIKWNKAVKLERAYFIIVKCCNANCFPKGMIWMFMFIFCSLFCKVWAYTHSAHCIMIVSLSLARPKSSTGGSSFAMKSSLWDGSHTLPRFSVILHPVKFHIWWIKGLVTCEYGLRFPIKMLDTRLYSNNLVRNGLIFIPKSGKLTYTSTKASDRSHKNFLLKVLWSLKKRFIKTTAKLLRGYCSLTYHGEKIGVSAICS